MARLLITALLPLTMLAAACDRPQPKVSDDLLQEFRAEFPHISNDCLNRIKFGDIEAMPSEVDKCFPMAKAQYWEGVWLDEFEGQLFCAKPAKNCTYVINGEKTWIDFPPDDGAIAVGPTGRLYAIKFIGRRTLHAGQFGHLGMASHAIVVDRLIAKSPVAAVPPDR